MTREATYSDYKSLVPSDFEVKWGVGYSVNEVLDSLGLDFITPALDGLNTFVSAAQAVLDIVDAIADFIIGLFDLAAFEFASLVVLIKEVIQEVINLFTGASINTLLHCPQTHKARRKPNEILYDVGMAYLDKKDPNRPITVSSVEAVSIVGVVSVPNLAALQEQYERFLRSLNLFKDSISNENRFKSVDENYQTSNFYNGTSGMAPDFELQKSLEESVLVRDIVNSLNKVLKLLEKGRSTSEKIRQVLSSAQRRLDALNNTIDQVLTAINSFANLLALGDSTFVLVCSGTGTDEDFARSIINAPLHPNYPRSDFLEEQIDKQRDKGIPVTLDREAGESLLYSGAILLHLQAATGASGIENINRLASLLFKDVGDRWQDFDEVSSNNLTATAKTLSNVRR